MSYVGGSNMFEQDINNIRQNIDEGKIHISVITFIGTGKLRFIKSFIESAGQNFEFVYVSTHKVIIQQFEQVVPGIRAYTVAEFNSVMYNEDYEPKRPPFIIFDNISTAARRRIQENNLLQNVVTISFSYRNDLGETLEKTDRFEKEIIGTRLIIDIRDLLLASKAEFKEVKDDVESRKARMNYYYNALVRKRNSVSELVYKTEDNPFQANTKEMLNNIEDKAISNAKIKFLDEMLGIKGIDISTINFAFNQIEAKKEELKHLLQSDDLETREAAYLELQQYTTGMSVKMAKENIDKHTGMQEIENLIENLSEDVWNKLSEESRSFLITAEYTYNSIKRCEYGDKMDFSGVCLLVSKTVEKETAERFFEKYKTYLNNKYGENYDLWPETMLTVEHSKTRCKKEKECTLGTFRYIMCDENNIPDEEFVEYMSDLLCEGKDMVSTEEYITDMVNFIEKVRVDYRNPSAHNYFTSRTSAKECISYVLEIEKKLKSMLENLKG